MTIYLLIYLFCILIILRERGGFGNESGLVVLFV